MANDEGGCSTTAMQPRNRSSGLRPLSGRHLTTRWTRSDADGTIAEIHNDKSMAASGWFDRPNSNQTNCTQMKYRRSVQRSICYARRPTGLTCRPVSYLRKRRDHMAAAVTRKQPTTALLDVMAPTSLLARADTEGAATRRIRATIEMRQRGAEQEKLLLQLLLLLLHCASKACFSLARLPHGNEILVAPLLRSRVPFGSHCNALGLIHHKQPHSVVHDTAKPRK
jgi:hypothetical protein